MKRTSLFSMLALSAATFLPLAAPAQVVPAQAPPAAPKYQVYAGFAYTSLNQVNQSRYGLMGAKVSVTRDWGKYFGLMASGDYYKWATGHSNGGNPGNPSVVSFMVGPEIHADLYGPLSGLVFGEVGAEHTGETTQYRIYPSVSFSGGFGGGMSYKLNDRFSLRATGDRVAGSFSLTGASPQNGYSTHMTWNARATVGAVYRF